jgi:hypothetical protein
MAPNSLAYHRQLLYDLVPLNTEHSILTTCLPQAATGLGTGAMPHTSMVADLIIVRTPLPVSRLLP